MLKKCALVWREAHLKVKMCKTRQHWATFRSSNVEKLHAAVARSAFPKKITDGVGARFEVPMSKKLHAAVARSICVS